MFVINQVKTNAYFEVCIYSYFHAIINCFLLFREQQISTENFNTMKL
jgi:hypothetical protein